MSNSNNQALTAQKPSFRMTITSDNYQKMINNVFNNPERTKRFTTSIITSVGVTPQLAECEHGSILAAALLGESLNLSPSPQLGQFYLVPFKVKGVSKAQFVMGYKGYLQLAMNSGLLKKFNAVPIKQGELKHYDPINEVFEFEPIQDFDEREKAPTIGYYAFFETLNGFFKAMFWSKEKMLSHADTYVTAFSRAVYEKIQQGEIPDKDLWKYSSNWYKNFDDMGRKTMIRQLVSKGGCPMSTEMQYAFENDENLVEVDDNGDFITTPKADEIVVEDGYAAGHVQDIGEPADENSVSPADIKPEANDTVQKVDLDSI